MWLEVTKIWFKNKKVFLILFIFQCLFTSSSENRMDIERKWFKGKKVLLNLSILQCLFASSLENRMSIERKVKKYIQKGEKGSIIERKWTRVKQYMKEKRWKKRRESVKVRKHERKKKKIIKRNWKIDKEEEISLSLIYQLWGSYSLQFFSWCLVCQLLQTETPTSYHSSHIPSWPDQWVLSQKSLVKWFLVDGTYKF